MSNEDLILKAVMEVHTELKLLSARVVVLENRDKGSKRWNTFFAALGALIGGFVTSAVF